MKQAPVAPNHGPPFLMHHTKVVPPYEPAAYNG